MPFRVSFKLGARDFLRVHKRSLDRSEGTKGMSECVNPYFGPRLAGQVAIVTGGGKGIGRATASLFARQGARVLVATRTEASGRETVDAIVRDGGKAALCTVNLVDHDAARQIVDAALKQFGRLDAVVHNAASVPFGPIGEIEDAVLDEVFAVNLKAAFWLIAEAQHALQQTMGVMLAVSSVTGNRQWQNGYSAYGASKAGLNGFVRMAAAELGTKGIRVNGVEPGLTLTETVINSFPAAEIEKIERAVPLGYTARPIDIAHALLFLASGDASRITGQIISVDAGQQLAGG